MGPDCNEKTGVSLFLRWKVENEDVGLPLQLHALIDDHQRETARTVLSEAFSLGIHEADRRHPFGIDRYDGLAQLFRKCDFQGLGSLQLNRFLRLKRMGLIREVLATS